MDLKSAKVASNNDTLAEWVHSYLQSENEQQIDDYLQRNNFPFLGPELVYIGKLERTIGPEPGMLHSETQEELETKIQRRLEQLKHASEPVLIAEELNGHFVICDGNHLYEALKLLGKTECWVIYWKDSRVHDEVAVHRLK